MRRNASVQLRIVRDERESRIDESLSDESEVMLLRGNYVESAWTLPRAGFRS